DGDSITYYDNTSLFNIGPSTGLISDTPTEAENGTYLVNITCGDTIDNASQLFNYTILDATKPIIYTVSVSPTKGAAGTLFNITANVTDGKEVKSVIAYIQKPDENDTATITLGLNNELYNGTWNSSNKADGTYVIDIKANDTSDNEEEKENGAVIALSLYAQNTFINSSFNLTANESLVINATSRTDTWLNITSDVNITSSVSIAKYSDNVMESVCPTISTELSKYIDIIFDNNTNENLSFVEVRVYYDDTEVSAASLQE
ncbi:unnamed protein product, partial [marine sediment metagenome]